MAQQDGGGKGACCGVPAAPPPSCQSPPSASWDRMSDWYASAMSRSTASLAFSILGHLGALDDNDNSGGDVGDGGGGLRFLETHCADAYAASVVLRSAAPSIASYQACDFSEAMVSKARARLGDCASVEVADSTALPYEAETFDRYMSNLGCCCVEDLNAKLKEAHRVLRPGGIAGMSMRIEGGDGDTILRPIGEVLGPYGYPTPPDREGLTLGKDLQALKAKVESMGFKSPVAWRTWITLPVHSEDDFMKFVDYNPMVRNVVASLDEQRRREALEALRMRARDMLEEGAIQMAVAVVVAKKRGA